ncbi:thioesterase II family protein [Virgisporangium aurantiacum]|uniref:Thioesterase n=1 Tax=Virgisporangium aurantiacum TaxID=175570 RepID=A0A8J3Z7K6_9ACTN|nr:alpha/beta fold hydrolase [Virgisporangium aurantiacum]GIJ56363.1 thioesterase [Virgisporangium aurantiacum]
MTDWYVPLRKDGAGDVRVVAFPHAGGGPASLATLAPMFPPHVEPWAVNLPGRQARLAEDPRTDLDGLVDDLAAALAAVPRPYALFGYCSGALLAYLVARHAAAVPARLVVGSFAAPDVAVVPRRLHALPSALFWDRLVAAGGIPAELAGHTDLYPALEPALRADFAMLAGYRHAPAAPVDAPVTVLYGRHDRSLTRGALLGWRRHTTTRPALRELNASHWLVDDAPAEVVRVIAEEIGCDSATA